MGYIKKLIIRIFLALVIALLGIKIFYPIISPLTFYLSYFSLFFLKPVLISSTMFSIGSHSLEFIPACAAASAYLLLTLLIFLTKDIKIKKGIKLFLIGSLAILMVNIIRIDFLIIILLKYSSNLFETLHLFIWKVLSSVFVVLIWIVLSKYFKIRTIPVYSDLKELRKYL